jgi:hypothetical protein
MEKDLRGIHTMAAVIKKKGELAVEEERYALKICGASTPWHHVVARLEASSKADDATGIPHE